MATPVGHFLAGVIAGAGLGGAEACTPYRRMLLGGFIAAAADLDFLPGLLIGDPARFHHAATHSVFFALLAGIAAAVLAPSARARWFLLASAAYGTHLLLDLVTVDPSPPRGIPLFWPASGEVFQSPIALIPQVLHTVVSPLNVHNLMVMVLEVVFLAPLAAFAAMRHRGATRASG